jgi:hypothetical protein
MLIHICFYTKHKALQEKEEEEGEEAEEEEEGGGKTDLAKN